MTAEAKTVTRRIVEECWNKNNPKLAEELIASNAPTHDPSDPSLRGPEGLKTQIALYRGAFPDLRMTIDSQVCEGDMVCTRWTARGTHRGPLMGMAPTQRQATVTGIEIDRVQNGKIVERWIQWDQMGMLQQLGLVPTMRPEAGGAGARPAHVHK
jgi:predicted ester cyclase